jgi:hypothetical protein
LEYSLCALALVGAVAFSAAQPAPPIKRIPLQKYDVPGTELETVVGIAEIAPDAHTSGSGIRLPAGRRVCADGRRSAAPKPLKAGEGYQIPSGAIHARSGPGGAKVLAVYIVRKSEPLASPVK